MTRIERFEDIEAWKEAGNLVREIYHTLQVKGRVLRISACGSIAAGICVDHGQ
jgi:hypothetical protein